jgi:hypothetical protein
MATIDSKKKWNDTGIDLEAGRRYRYQATGRWTDWFHECDADGFSNAVMDLSTSAKRVPSARWFQLIGDMAHWLAGKLARFDYCCCPYRFSVRRTTGRKLKSIILFCAGAESRSMLAAGLEHS